MSYGRRNLLPSYCPGGSGFHQGALESGRGYRQLFLAELVTRVQMAIRDKAQATCCNHASHGIGHH